MPGIASARVVRRCISTSRFCSICDASIAALVGRAASARRRALEAERARAAESEVCASVPTRRSKRWYIGVRFSVWTRVEAAARCDALVGGFDASIAVLMLSRMTARLGTVPPFFSPTGTLCDNLNVDFGPPMRDSCSKWPDRLPELKDRPTDLRECLGPSVEGHPPGLSRVAASKVRQKCRSVFDDVLRRLVNRGRALQLLPASFRDDCPGHLRILIRVPLVRLRGSIVAVAED